MSNGEQIWRIPFEEYVASPHDADWQELPEEEQWHYLAARRNRQREWRESYLRAASQGRASTDVPEEHDLYYEFEKWKELPWLLFHVTTGLSSVMDKGLLSRAELNMEYGLGLGGGPEDTISFTASFATAVQIRDAILLAQQVALGNFTLADMLQQSKEGTDASRPYYEFFLSYYQTPKQREEGVFPQVFTEVLETGDISATADIFRWWLIAREDAGGPMNPLFVSSDIPGLAEIPEEEIEILVARPPKGSKGINVSGLGEWRLYSTRHLDLIPYSEWGSQIQADHYANQFQEFREERGFKLEEYESFPEIVAPLDALRSDMEYEFWHWEHRWPDMEVIAHADDHVVVDGGDYLMVFRYPDQQLNLDINNIYWSLAPKWSDLLSDIYAISEDGTVMFIEKIEPINFAGGPEWESKIRGWIRKSVDISMGMSGFAREKNLYQGFDFANLRIEDFGLDSNGKLKLVNYLALLK